MRAIVCDKCGKTVLMGDEYRMYPDGMNRLSLVSKKEEIDLCDECTEELMEAVREVKDNG